MFAARINVPVQQQPSSQSILQWSADLSKSNIASGPRLPDITGRANESGAADNSFDGITNDG